MRIGEDCYFFKMRQWLLNRKARKLFQHFGKDSQFRPGAYAVHPENIWIGQDVIIRPGCKLFADEHSEIIIDHDVLLGHDIHIYTNNHVLEDDSYEYGTVILREGCWVGARSIILKGVMIGKKAIVGAGSVVTHNIPAGETWGGVPARRI